MISNLSEVIAHLPSLNLILRRRVQRINDGFRSTSTIYYLERNLPNLSNFPFTRTTLWTSDIIPQTPIFLNSLLQVTFGIFSPLPSPPQPSPSMKRKDATTQNLRDPRAPQLRQAGVGRHADAVRRRGSRTRSRRAFQNQLRDPRRRPE